MCNYSNAVDSFVEKLNSSEVKQLLTSIQKYHKDIYDPIVINSLSDSKTIFMSDVKCHSFLPIGVYIEGWIFPRNSYDTIEIYRNEVLIGEASLDINRIDVYNRFRFFDLKNCGYNAFIEGKKGLSHGDKIAIIVKKDGKTIKKAITSIVYHSSSEVLSILESEIHTENNIFVPTLSNRMEMLYYIAKAMPNYNFVTMIEGMEFSIQEFENKCNNDYGLSKEELNQLYYFLAPGFLLKNQIPDNKVELCIDKNIKENVESNIRIKEACQNFSSKYYVSENYAERFCCACLAFFENVLNVIKPKGIMIWNKYSPAHQMLAIIAEKRNIPVVYMENGVLPGTLIFEQGGQMGESYPAVRYEEFLKLVVDEKEIENASKIQEELYRNKLNRWTSSDPSVYKKSEKTVVCSRLEKGKKTIFYAGQNDYESGLYPYNDLTKKYHSPYFESSEEVAIYLAKMCEKNGWNFIYKRHPMMRGKHCIDMPSNVIVSDNIDIHDAIDISDLTVTILSQTSYVSLLRKKPVLMLGYHQLKRKGCIYEINGRSDIEIKIKEALKKGFTSEQQFAFKKHIAQLCHYYLYRDFTNNTIKYGKTLEQLAGYLESVFDNNVIDNEKEEYKFESILLHNNEEIPSHIEFTYNLSLKERIARKKILNHILNNNPLDSFILPGNEYQWMYISQLDTEILKKYNWEKKFIRYFHDILIKKNYEQLDLLILLDKEIQNRLRIKELIVVAYEDSLKKYDMMVCLFDYILSENSTHIEQHIVERIIELIKKEDDVYSNVKQYVFSDNYKVFNRIMANELLIRAGKVNEATVQNMIHMLYEVDNKELKFELIVMELAWITFLYPNSVFYDYYLKRRKLMMSLVSEIKGRTQVKDNNYGNKKSVVILTTGLHGKNYASTRLQVGIANELSERGYEVRIFATDTNYTYDNELYPIMPITARYNTSKTIFQREHWEILNNNVLIKYFIEDENYIARYNNVINAIYEVNPFAIIDITNENAIYNIELINDFNVISVPLSGYWTSAVCSTYVIRNFELTELANKIYRSIDINKSVEGNVYLPYPIDKKKYKRSDYAFNKDDILIVSVGNRLTYELLPKYQKDMRDLLEDNHKMRWILVGRYSIKDFEILNDEIESGRVVLWGYENNLERLYRMCDIYLDVPRVGGGGGTCLACQSGLPVVNVRILSDVLPYLGVENSSKTWEEALEKLKTLVNDKHSRKELYQNQIKNLRDKRWKIEHFVDVIESVMI